MTRYTRAKGSKASNERLPKDATPWHIMKQQLETKQEKPKIITKSKSAKELLKEKEHSLDHRTATVNSNWAEFEESKPTKKQQGKDSKLKTTRIRKEIKENQHSISAILKQTASSDINTDEIGKQLKNGICETTSNALSKQLKRKFSEHDSNHITNENKKSNIQKSYSTDQNIDTKNDENILRKTNKEREENDSIDTNTNAQTDNLGSEVGENPQIKKEKKLEHKQKDAKNENSKSEGKLSKRQKRNIKKKENNVRSSRAFNMAGNDWKNSVEFNEAEGSEKSENNTENRNQQNDSAGHFGRIQNQSNSFINRTNKFGKRNLNQRNKLHHLKTPKVRDDKEHKRRKPDVPMRVMINGKEIELVKYDGFPIKKKDAERLKDLKQKMIMKGIPKSEIDVAMKLERRRAEKSLAREKKNVCFHCRIFGHNLSECPGLKDTENGTGICFKCGSTEHTHFECKVTKTAEYRYATCFICREQGHISKQCPDNPKGVYPQGGACKLCGDVTHLKKDCPDLIQQNEETAITLGTINGAALESLDGEAATNKNTAQKTNSKEKIVKF